MTTTAGPATPREGPTRLEGYYGERVVRAGSVPGRQRSRFLQVSAGLFFLLAAASWFFVLSEEDTRFTDLLSAETWEHGRRFLSRLFGAGTARPAFFDPERWVDAAGLAYQTLAMSVLAIGFATLGMLATVIPAARTAADGSMTLSRQWTAPVLFVVIRTAYIFSRAVPELVWAMLIVFVFSPGVLPGAIALGLHNFGILGKLCAEVVEDLDLRPARVVRRAGASSLQTLVYAVLPSALPQFLTYILYRWEVIIRTTIVVGFVSAAGLGREFKLRMSYFHYTDVALLLLVYFLLVLSVDLMSAALRRLAR